MDGQTWATSGQYEIFSNIFDLGTVGQKQLTHIEGLRGRREGEGRVKERRRRVVDGIRIRKSVDRRLRLVAKFNEANSDRKLAAFPELSAAHEAAERYIKLYNIDIHTKCM